MPGRRTSTNGTPSPYWKKRLASKGFRDQLIGLVAAEIDALAPLHVQDLIEQKVIGAATHRACGGALEKPSLGARRCCVG